MKKPKILYFDIETSPIIAHVWDLWKVNVGINQIQQDWAVISWAAKWSGKKKMMQQDNRKCKSATDDKKLLQGIHKLLDEADIIITKNGKAFDVKKLNARFIYHGMKPPSSYYHVDVDEVAKKKFAFTSNRLEYLSEKLNRKYQKLKHKKFPGHELWSECLKGNQAAWKEMALYNKYDVLALEELYQVLASWDDSIRHHIFYRGQVLQCQCSSTSFKSHGYHYTATGKFQRLKCLGCGTIIQERKNLLLTRKTG